ncbi:MAG: heme-binding protein [Gammaproteobacteria bacterium]|nr:heme-binding protein [Gammaproteobacteria bacterium]MCZ6585928.1 heme-binding protein [Gammaproteobacteria bacterium]
MNEQVKSWHLALVAVGLALSAGPLAAQDIEEFVISAEAAKSAKTRDEISLDTARRIADHCFQQAAERNLGTSIFVLSPSGHIVYALRADGQTPIATETALLKAKTAVFMRGSTHAQMNRVMQDPARDRRLRPLQAEFDLFWNSGGLPIVVDGVMIGAIGVGGMAPSAEWSDEICANNALTDVIGPQPPLAPFLQ